MKTVDIKVLDKDAQHRIECFRYNTIYRGWFLDSYHVKICVEDDVIFYTEYDTSGSIFRKRCNAGCSDITVYYRSSCPELFNLKSIPKDSAELEQYTWIPIWHKLRKPNTYATMLPRDIHELVRQYLTLSI